MAYQVNIICSYPGCTKLIIAKPGRPGRCEKHPVQQNTKYQRLPDTRQSAHRRGYDENWKRLRDAKLRRKPICEPQYKCEGDPAVEVDHIKTIADHPELRLTTANLQSICRVCHQYKTKVLDRGKKRAT